MFALLQSARLTWTTLIEGPDRSSQQRLSDHANAVIADWASVMVGAAPSAEVLDRHVELRARLEWLSSVLAHNDPAPDQGGRGRRLNLANIATEHADQFDDEWVRNIIVSITGAGDAA